MKAVTFRGTGQMNGVKVIHKTIELEDDIVQSLYGPSRYDVIIDILKFHYPGVNVNPRQINVQVKDLVKPKNETKTKSEKERKPITFWSIISWIIFFPFKITWRILKVIWKEPHI